MTANAHTAAPDGVSAGGAKEGPTTEGRPSVRPRLVARLRRVGPRRRLRTVASGGDAVYQARAALPHQHRGRATEGLRSQLTIMALATGLTPDWSTLAVAGPTEVPGTQHGARFEWTGRVAMRGFSPLATLPDPDFVPQYTTANGDTVPFGASTAWNGPEISTRAA